MTTRTRPSRSPVRRARGFTLVELLVALTAGLVVSAAAYVLARNSMKAYQDESRIAAGQVAVSAGFNRLVADLARAGYMSSPNTAGDPQLCGTLPGGVPAFVPVQLLKSGSDLNTLDSRFGYGTAGENPDIADPDLIVVTGNMTSVEQFEFRVVDGGIMYLAMDRGPMLRLLQDTGGVPQTIRDVFVAASGEPRFARVVDQAGKHSYIRVVDVNITTSGSPAVVTQVDLVVEDAAGGTLSNTTAGCGFVNRGNGLVNPLSIVRYRVGRPTTTAFDRATNPQGQVAVTGEDLRTELLREEISPDSAGDIANVALTVGAGELASQEISAEFAVALDFSVYASTAPGLELVPFDAGQSDVDAVLPERYRALGVRLATRARVPDRNEPGPAGVVTRFFLNLPNPTTQNYARMRTLQGQVQLPNLAGVQR